jgi:hypothetical protein
VHEPGFAWLRGHDPQGEIARLVAQHGHEMGPWEFVGELRTGHDLWRHDGRFCTRCGRLAAYGQRRKEDGRTALAIWGAALTEACTARQAREGGGL